MSYSITLVLLLGWVPISYFKVISKGPGAQHLKEGVVVHILSHVIQVIMFTTSTDALLGVGSTLQSSHGVGWVDGV